MTSPCLTPACRNVPVLNLQKARPVGAALQAGRQLFNAFYCFGSFPQQCPTMNGLYLACRRRQYLTRPLALTLSSGEGRNTQNDPIPSIPYISHILQHVPLGIPGLILLRVINAMLVETRQLLLIYTTMDLPIAALEPTQPIRLAVL